MTIMFIRCLSGHQWWNTCPNYFQCTFQSLCFIRCLSGHQWRSTCPNCFQCTFSLSFDQHSSCNSCHPNCNLLLSLSWVAESIPRRLYWTLLLFSLSIYKKKTIKVTKTQFAYTSFVQFIMIYEREAKFRIAGLIEAFLKVKVHNFPTVIKTQ